MNKLDETIYAMLRERTLAKLAPSDEAAYQVIRTEGDARFRIGLARDPWTGMSQVVAEKPDLLADYLRECGVTTTDVEKTHHEKEMTMPSAHDELTALTKRYQAAHPGASDLETLNALARTEPAFHPLWKRVMGERDVQPVRKVQPREAPPEPAYVTQFRKMVSDCEADGMSHDEAERSVLQSPEGQALYAQYRQDYGR
jgi:hypothetical protein